LGRVAGGWNLSVAPRSLGHDSDDFRMDRARPEAAGGVVSIHGLACVANSRAPAAQQYGWGARILRPSIRPRSVFCPNLLNYNRT
jgi:hypothetical protein